MKAVEYVEYEANLFPWNREEGFKSWIDFFLDMNSTMSQNINILNLMGIMLFPPLVLARG
jgi:hypothetical protein